MCYRNLGYAMVLLIVREVKMNLSVKFIVRLVNSLVRFIKTQLFPSKINRFYVRIFSLTLSFINRICVNQKHICDGHNDCPAAEDEKNCPTHRECGTNSKCEQMCITSFNGREDCACRNGFSIHSNGYK